MQGDNVQKQALIASFRGRTQTAEQEIAAQYAEMQTLAETAQAHVDAQTEVEGAHRHGGKAQPDEKEVQEKNKDILLLERESRLEQ